MIPAERKHLTSSSRSSSVIRLSSATSPRRHHTRAPRDSSSRTAGAPASGFRPSSAIDRAPFTNSQRAITNPRPPNPPVAGIRLHPREAAASLDASEEPRRESGVTKRSCPRHAIWSSPSSDSIAVRTCSASAASFASGHEINQTAPLRRLLESTNPGRDPRAAPAIARRHSPRTVRGAWEAAWVEPRARDPESPLDTRGQRLQRRRAGERLASAQGIRVVQRVASRGTNRDTHDVVPASKLAGTSVSIVTVGPVLAALGDSRRQRGRHARRITYECPCACGARDYGQQSAPANPRPSKRRLV